MDEHGNTITSNKLYKSITKVNREMWSHENIFMANWLWHGLTKSGLMHFVCVCKTMWGSEFSQALKLTGSVCHEDLVCFKAKQTSF